MSKLHFNSREELNNKPDSNKSLGFELKSKNLSNVDMIGEANMY
jgi:hypothetical protein